MKFIIGHFPQKLRKLALIVLCSSLGLVILYEGYSSNGAGFLKSLQDQRHVVLNNRRILTFEKCKQYKKQSFKNSIGRIKNRNLLYNKDRNVTYCMVEKSGSTFWRRIFYLMATNSNNKSGAVLNPYSIDNDYVHAYKLPTYRMFSEKQTMDALNHSSKIIFVREPYERTFSGYLDKFISLNSYYFPYMGKPAIFLTRPNATSKSLKCGHDLQFTELLKYILYLEKNKKYIDVHFSSIHQHCRPCEVQYDYIGKMETFNMDAKYILDQVNAFPSSEVIFNAKTNMLENIKITFKYMFHSQLSYKDCFTLPELVERSWKVLQLRGIIPPYSALPKLEQSNLTEDFLVNLALKSSDYQNIEKNRQFQMIELYKTVDKETLEQFRKFVSKDCMLFGYPDRPYSIFGDL